MKTRLFFFFLLFAATIVSPLAAQPNLLRRLNSDVIQEGQRRAGKAMLRSLWDGKGPNFIMVGMLQQAEIRQGLEITDEQFEKMRNQMMSGVIANPEFASIQAELQKLQADDPYFEKADAETKEKFLGLQEKMFKTMVDTIPDDFGLEFTAEQKRKIDDFQLAVMSEIPIVRPSTFNALGLSDEQKKSMEAIKKELEPDFEKTVELFMEHQRKTSEIFARELAKEEFPDDDPGKVRERIQAVAKRLREEDPEYRRLHDEIIRVGQGFASRLKFKMLDVLTDEQLARLEDLIDNPPEYIKAFLEKVRKQMGQKQSGSVQGLDSWKPGEPIPEEYRQQRRQKRFPAKE